MNKIYFSDCILFGFVFGTGGGMTGLFGLLVDGVLDGFGVSATGILFLSHFFTGLLLCALYWQWRARRTERQHVHEDRMNKVALMNHYVRNALEVLSFHGSNSSIADGKAAVAQAVKRIEWALSDVLPCGWEIDDRLAKPMKGREELSPALPSVSTPIAEPKAR